MIYNVNHLGVVEVIPFRDVQVEELHQGVVIQIPELAPLLVEFRLEALHLHDPLEHLRVAGLGILVQPFCQRRVNFRRWPARSDSCYGAYPGV